MAKNLTRKIIEEHSLSGLPKPNQDVALKVDQVLLQDATGTQACMQFELLGKKYTGQETVVADESLQDGISSLLHFEQFGIDEVKVPFAIQYVDHNIKQIDERNADDHAFLFTFCQRYGIWYSPLGNGICHQVHVERFAVPGAFILGADSHTTTSGAVGAIALGIGGLDIASVLAGYPFQMRMPKIVRVSLVGKLRPWVSAKDVILELLRRFKVTWGIDVAGIGGTMVIEFGGSGVKTLNVPQRATICNMAAELNATAIFPSDERTLEFFKIQRREWAWRELKADIRADYDLNVEIDLSRIEPLIACPSSPDNVVTVQEVEGTPVAQVCIGSSVNSWYEDLAIVATVLKNKCIPSVNTPEGLRRLQLLISPGSQQILNVMERMGFSKVLRDAGALILESACGPCVGMGGAPPSNTNSVRTMNRNFPGRSGTKNDKVWLVSSETAAASALYGVITDPRKLGKYPDIGKYELDLHDFTDHLITTPPTLKEARQEIKIIRGPHIVSPPTKNHLTEEIKGEVIAKFGDNISTGSISPDGVIVMGKRSNVGDIAKHTFGKEMPSQDGGASEFYRRAMEAKLRNGGFIVAGQNYGQGSSREAAAMVMVELGIHSILAKSFARIHRGNLISQGIIPLVISDETYTVLQAGQRIVFPKIRQELEEKETITVRIENQELQAKHFLSTREKKLLIAGGLIKYIKSL